MPRRDRDLIRLHWPAELRPAFDALFDVDDAMGAVVTNATQPALAAVKLAWWRERLEELDDRVVPAEPRLAAAARELLPRRISGRELAELEEPWALLLNEKVVDRAPAVPQRASRLFGLAARLLNLPMDDLLADAATSFVTVDFARRGLFAVRAQMSGQRAGKASREARPLTSFGALARRDMRRGGPRFEAEAAPGRAWTLLRHRVTGR